MVPRRGGGRGGLATPTAAVVVAICCITVARDIAHAAGADVGTAAEGSHSLLAAEQAATTVRYAGYTALVTRLHALAAAAPDYVSLWSAQQRYGLPSPGQCDDVPCEHWFVTLTRNASACQAGGRGAGCTHPDLDVHAWHRRPQVFLSGNLHGDETVGPMALITMLEDLVTTRLGGGNAWVNWLLDTRHIVAIPITNPWGYARGVRDEAGRDPNRDFPFVRDPAQCMTTVAARAVNEVWREHVFTLAVTFHGGMQSITYEWGSPNHEQNGSESPDDEAQAALGRVMVEMAGAYREGRYPLGRTNTVVYAVNGGMEDWAYAGSWDTASVQPCQPTSYGGYPVDKTRYNDAQLRAFNFLVETAQDKRPSEEALGKHAAFADAMVVQGPTDGHVPRNMRIVAAMLDLVSPYVMHTRLAATVVRARLPAPTRRRGLRGGGVGDAPDGGALAGWGDGHARLNRRLLLSPDRTASGGVGSSRMSAPTRTVAQRQAPRRMDGGDAVVSAPSGTSGVTSPCVMALPLATASTSHAPQRCSEHVGQYDAWVHVALRPAAASGEDIPLLPVGVSDGGSLLSAVVEGSHRATVSFDVGWDVGGAVAVDSTMLLVGSWDVRVPPAWFHANPVGDMRSHDIGPASVPPAVIDLLVQQHGLTPVAAAAFALHVRVWQLVAVGQLPVADVPDAVLLRRGESQAGVTRWVFGELGNQPHTTNTTSPVPGAPDLGGAPFTTRFTDCLRVPLPPMMPSSGGDGDTTPAVLSCAGGNDDGADGRVLWGEGGARSLQQRQPSLFATPQHAPTYNNTRVYASQGYIALPVAMTDAAFQQQHNPTPAGTRPQSHFVNARFDPTWDKRNGRYAVVGACHAAAQPRFLAVSMDARMDVTTAPGEAPVVDEEAGGVLCELVGGGDDRTGNDVESHLPAPLLWGVSLQSWSMYTAVISGMLLAASCCQVLQWVRWWREHQRLAAAIRARRLDQSQRPVLTAWSSPSPGGVGVRTRVPGGGGFQTIPSAPSSRDDSDGDDDDDNDTGEVVVVGGRLVSVARGQ